MALTFDGPISEEETMKMRQVLLAERMGWTMDYVRSLDLAEFCEIEEILRSTDAATRELRYRASRRLSGE